MSKKVASNEYTSVTGYATNVLLYPEDGEWNLLDRSVRGNVVFDLIGNGVDKMIAITYVERINGHWMHRSYTEKDHPYYYDCPKKYVKASTIMEHDAVVYKAECVYRQDQKKILRDYIKKLRTGDVVNTTSGEVIYHDICEKRMFVGRDMRSGKLFRYNVSSIRMPEKGV